MARSRTILIAGAGIGGLTAALALARAGFRVVVLETAPQQQAVGAGIQLSPNAVRVLAKLGLAERLRPHVVAPDAVQVLRARSGTEIVRIPLAESPSADAVPYWAIHRGDLQQALHETAAGHPDIVLRFGVSVVDHASHANGITVLAKTRSGVLVEEQGLALVGADGLWSAVRKSLDHPEEPRFRRRTAWRALLPAEAVEPRWTEPRTTLWLGPRAHLVHYPVRGGSAVNVVAIVTDPTEIAGWSAEGTPEVLLARFARWAPAARALLQVPQSWRRWSLYDLPRLRRWGAGPVTLLGDAAHAMLPFVAQGAAMAIEDAAVLATCMAGSADNLPAAFRAYEAQRGKRTARVAQAADRSGRLYHLRWPLALARDRAMRTLGGDRLRRRNDWIYGWTPP